MTIGEQIRRFRRERDLTQEYVAEQMEISMAYISKIENSKSDVDTALLRKFADVFKVKMSDFFPEDEKRSAGDIEKDEAPRYKLGGPSSHPDEVELDTIPVYDYVRAGVKNMVFDAPPVDYIAVPASSDKTRFGVRVKGDSMEPAIVEGDVVVVSMEGEPHSGDPCLVNFSDGEYVLRYVFFAGDVVTLTSGNRKYPPVTIQRVQIKSLLRVVARSSGAEQLRMR